MDTRSMVEDLKFSYLVYKCMVGFCLFSMLGLFIFTVDYYFLLILIPTIINAYIAYKTREEYKELEGIYNE